MKAYSCLGASLLSALLIGASSGLAQINPGGPILWPPWPPNAGPTVEIVTPSDGSMFLAPADIHIAAFTAYFTDMVASVEFFAGTNSLGVVTNNSKSLGWPEPSLLPDRLFWLAWTNVPPGDYALTATATDAAGNTVTSAAVDISVVTNFPPCVVITKPKNGALILGPTDIKISAAAVDRDGGTVTQVEFFEGTNSLGVVTNIPVTYITNNEGVFPIKNTSFSLTWSNVPLGDYVLTAVATDNDGATTVSKPVDISVVSNLPPVVRLIAPYNGATYFAPATVGICAVARDPDGTVASVEFFAGTNSLGVVTTGTVVTNREGVYELFCFTWDAVAKGDYTLTAVATDNAGATATSAPVSIRVLPPPSPLVRITTPERGEVFMAPANIWICSVNRFFPDRVASVQYFAGTNSLGIATNGPEFCFRWTKVPAGAYSLTATATDVSGTNVVTSPPVNITVKTKPKAWAIEGPAAINESSQ
jgi:Bacterial Ig domain